MNKFDPRIIDDDPILISWENEPDRAKNSNMHYGDLLTVVSAMMRRCAQRQFDKDQSRESELLAIIEEQRNTLMSYLYTARKKGYEDHNTEAGKTLGSNNRILGF